MSLAHQQLAANPIILQSFSTSALDSPYVSVQLPFAQMERLLDQLSSLASYASLLFEDLTTQTVYLTHKLDAVSKKLDTIGNQMPSVVPAPSQSHSRVAWAGDHSITSNLFIKSSMPKTLKLQYDKCQPAPRLELLDRFRTDGLPCMRFYSYPEFFVDEWKALMQKPGSKAKRKQKENIKSIERRKRSESKLKAQDRPNLEVQENLLTPKPSKSNHVVVSSAPKSNTLEVPQLQEYNVGYEQPESPPATTQIAPGSPSSPSANASRPMQKSPSASNLRPKVQGAPAPAALGFLTDIRSNQVRIDLCSLLSRNRWLLSKRRRILQREATWLQF